MKHPLVFVLYDSITNSIFDSQIAEPLIRQQTDPQITITVISFEKKTESKRLKTITHQYPTITFIFLKNRIFLHKTLLNPLVQKLHQILKQLPSYKLIARGPIAGYLCTQAVEKTACLEFIIQARAILAEEYRFTHAHSNTIFTKAVHYFRAYFYEQLERSVYRKQFSYSVPTTIESVSPTLKEYLITNYYADANMIMIAQSDIPAPFSLEVITKWRKNTRKELNLSENRFVYCYNGSLKPWQCPEETLSFFKQELSKNRNAFLLILTHNKEEFEALIKKRLDEPTTYKVLAVPHKEIYRYLAACDAGVILREKNSINWTSRPTKILEYQAVNLPIIHNNTIAILENS